MIDILYQKPLLGRQINWAHPHAKGLMACWLLNEGSGGRLHDSTKRLPSSDFTTYPGTWIPEGIEFDGSDDLTLIDFEPLQAIIGAEFTVVIKFRTIARVPFTQTIFQAEDSEPFTFQKTGDTNLRFIFEFTGGVTTVNVGGGETLGSGVWVTALMTGRSGEQRFYVDAVEVGSDTQTGTPDVGFGSEDLILSTGNTWNGEIQYIMMWNKFMFPDMVESFTRESYAMFQQNRVRWFSIPVAVADGGIIPHVAVLNRRRRI